MPKKTRKRRKIARTTLFFCVISFIFVVVSVNAFLDHEKETIQFFVSENFGVDIKYETATIKFIPRLGLSFRNLEVANPNSLNNPFITTSSVYVDLDIFALFLRQVLIDEVTLKRAKIRYESKQEQAKKSNGLLGLNTFISRIKKLSLQDSTFLHLSNKKTYEFKNINLKSGFESDFQIITLPETKLSFEFNERYHEVNAEDLQIDLRSAQLSSRRLEVQDRSGRFTFTNLSADEEGIKNVELSSVNFDLSLLPGFMATLDVMSPELNSQRGFLTSEIHYQRTDNGKRFKGSIDLRNYAIQNGEDFYKIKHLRGPVQIDISEKSKITSDLDVESFSYEDNQTKLSDADFKLTDVVANIDEKGSVFVTLKADGTSLKLVAPSTRVNQIGWMKGELKVSAPASGGYLVAGPVTLSGGDLSFFDNPLKQASAVANINVSKNLKTFKTTNASYLYLEKMQNLNMLLEITPLDYTIKDTLITQADGVLTAKGQQMRGKHNEFTLDVSAKNFDFKTLLSFFIDQRKAESYTGIVQNLSLHAQGQKAKFFETVNASGSFKFNQGFIKDLNFNQKVIQVLEEVKFIGSRKDSKQGLDRKKQEMQSDFIIKNQKVYLSNLDIERDWYSIEGKGELDFDLNLAIDANILLLKETTKIFGLGIKPLQKLFQKIGTVEVPIKIKGQLPEIDVEADLKRMAKKYSGVSMLESIWDGVVGVVK